MPRKGKEPAGLRRYRLAQKRKKRGGRTRRVRRVKRRPTMARRRKGRRKGKSSIPVLPVLPVAYVTYSAVKNSQSAEGAMNAIMGKMTGYFPMTGAFDADSAKPFWIGEGVAIVVHKVANKTGVNKHIRKMTGGWLSL